MRHAVRCFLLSSVLALAVSSLVHAGTLDPLDFTPLGTLSWSSGSYTIDTDALTIVDDAAPGTPLYSGVVDDQGGSADSFGGVPGPLGIPEIAVFTFTGITLDGTATVTVVGSRALALLSQGDILIDRTLALDGEYAMAGESAVPGAGGPGGFAGGAPGLDGVGPGAGVGLNVFSFTVGQCGGGGSFGGTGGFQSCGVNPASGGGGPYGNLRQSLQGGSGGGGVTTLVPENVAGGGGGGALELGATGTLTIGASGIVRANGGLGQGKFAGVGAIGGAGSGGGVRLSASLLVLDGVVEARGTFTTVPLDGEESAGGRVLRMGDASVGSHVVGSGGSVAALTAGVDVSPGARTFPEATQGWITAVPVSTIVPPAASFELGSVETLQSPSTSQPGVEVFAQDLIAHGQLTVPAGGITYDAAIEMGSLAATLTGADPLGLGPGATLSGSGTVQVDVDISSGGRIVVIGGDHLTFTGSVTPEAGASMTVVGSRVTVPGDGLANDDGIVNLGTLNLVDAIVDGDVRSPAGSTVNVAGTATFNGFVSGAGVFSGTTNLVTFNGGYSPGDSPAALAFGGDIAFGAGSDLTMEMLGVTPGSEHDQLNIAGTAYLDGGLVLAPGPSPSPGDSFTLLTWGASSGEFASVTGVQQAGGIDLALRYDAGAAVVAAVLRGDVNGDGLVTSADTAIVTGNLGLATTAYTAGDVDGSGTVDAVDEAIVAAAAGVPVPGLTSGVLFALATCLGLSSLRLIGPRVVRASVMPL